MTNPVCAIVGAGEGLGAALAARFARGGFDIALVSRSAFQRETAAKAAMKANSACHTQIFEADATNPESIEKTVDDIQEQMGAIEVLIYNARGGFKSPAPIDISYKELEDIFRLEVVGAFASAKSVLPSMLAKNRGSIIFSSATAAYRGSATNALYAIGKFGLRALSQSLAKAYSKDGVHIVHMRLDCDLDVPIMRDIYGKSFDADEMAKPTDVAETYWWAHHQPKGAWSNEIELRPYTEKWSY